MLDGWHGIFGVCVSVPTIVGRLGAGMNAETLAFVDDYGAVLGISENFEGVQLGVEHACGHVTALPIGQAINVDVHR